MALSMYDIVIRLLLSVAVGWILGKERKIRQKPVGTRTHILICLTATLISILSAYGYSSFEGSRTMDPARLTTGILTGIGFIGAGIIWKDNSGGIRGITTAANLFLTACLGIAIGIGQYFLTACAVVLAIITLETSSFFQKRNQKKEKQKENFPEDKNPIWSYDVQDGSEVPIAALETSNQDGSEEENANSQDSLEAELYLDKLKNER